MEEAYMDKLNFDNQERIPNGDYGCFCQNLLIQPDGKNAMSTTKITMTDVEKEFTC